MAKRVKPTGLSPALQVKELENNPELIDLCAQFLPPNYEFEIPKTVWRIQKTKNCTTVALQMPEGLLIFATRIAEVLRRFTGVDTILMGDITYGACCVDDFTASMLGAQLLVHYGHSCLVPTSVANHIETIYVFVTIKFDVEDTVQSIHGLLKEKSCKKDSKHVKISCCQDDDVKPVNISLVSTIQFAASLPAIKEALETKDVEAHAEYKIKATIPRSKPLSNGEILGCTAPKVQDDLILYVGDGRFHLEAMMMANPSIEAYRYDPYNKTLTHEGFDHEALSKSRQASVNALMKTAETKKLVVGIILGTLGRQGNTVPMEYVYTELSKRYTCFVVLMSEVFPAKLEMFDGVDLWVQFACPRLSIDWGSAFKAPILTPYEAIWGSTQANSGKTYEGHPMDYYAYDSLGPHTPNFKPPAPIKQRS